MKNHTKIYLNYFGYGTEDFIPCEIPGCTRRAVDVCHIDNRKAGGDPTGAKDVIENLMGKCREHHNQYGDVPEARDWLIEIHLKFMKEGKRD